MARLTDRNDWFEVWQEDRESVESTMQRNLAADLECGYNPAGYSVLQQRATIARHEMETMRAYELFNTMEEKAVNRWCFYDLLQRGAIA